MKMPSLFQYVTVFLTAIVQFAAAAPNATHEAWTDPAALSGDLDFAIQGEYQGKAIGVQVVALGDSRFDAYVLEGGLPGAGWKPGNKREILHGTREDKTVRFLNPAAKNSATIQGGKLILTDANNVMSELVKTERHSPTLGAVPPAKAVILFDSSSTDAWENGKMENGLLLSTGCTSKQRFGDYTLHLEFRTPYMPSARGQQRGNSGIYHSGRWETQILDSFGLDGKDNECGGIYSISKPRLNMCLPPLTWQTYDVQFTAAKFDANGIRTAWPRITVKLNGEIVHENLELAKDFTTSAPINQPLANPEGPVFLQNHKNPVAFRNIWIVPGP